MIKTDLWLELFTEQTLHGEINGLITGMLIVRLLSSHSFRLRSDFYVLTKLLIKLKTVCDLLVLGVYVVDNCQLLPH